MSLAKLSVKNSVLVNMIVVIVFIAGIYVANNIPKEEMPAIDFGSFVIVVAYPGVSPSEIESLILNKIEKEIYDVEDIDFIRSDASEGKAVIFVRMEPDADIEKAWTDINTELDKVRDLPEDATDPVIIKLNMREINPICTISLSGEFSPLSLKDISESLQDEILQIDYISKVDITGQAEREIAVECDRDKLDSYGITIDEIINVIRGNNISFPAGTVTEGEKEYIATATGEYETPEDIGKSILRYTANGNILIEHVAAVKDTLKEMKVYSRLNGKSGIFLYVYKKADGNIIDVIEDVKSKTEDYSNRIKGLDIALRNDGSIDVKRSLNALSSNAVIGVILVFFSLWIFIGWRNALLAGFGIPFTFLLTFIIMSYFDITMNNLTLFALLLVLGMIVDDAIVVIENVHRYRELGLSPEEAAITGTRTIMWPVISAVMTTVFAFVPMVIMQGMMGKFMRYFPIVVSIALMASLFEALVVLPSHLSEFAGKKVKKQNNGGKLLNCIKNYYRKLLLFALRNRIKTTVFVFICLLASFGVLASGLIKVEFFPSSDPQTIVLRYKLPTGVDLDRTEVMTAKIEKFIKTMKAGDDVVNIIATVGQMVNNHRLDQKTNYGELRIDLEEPEDLTHSNDEIKAIISGFLENEPDIISYEWGTVQAGPPTGKDVELRIKGDDYEELKKISGEIQKVLNRIEGVTAVADNHTKGKPELIIRPDRQKAALYGISPASAASFIRTAVSGMEVTDYIDDNEEVPVRVRIDPKQADEIEELKNLKIRSPEGYNVKLKDLAVFTIKEGVAQISHWNKKRTITVTAETSFYDKDGERKKRSPNEVNEILFGNELKGIKGKVPVIMEKHAGYAVDAGGIAEEQRKSFNSLYLAFGIAVLLIFSVLAAQFHSYVQPLIVMLTIPFSFIGVIFGLFVTNLPFSLNSLIAVVALAGIVVNDSLILVDFVNKLRDEGKDRWNSLIEAGMTRLRPILLTTVTTIFGLMPMILSTSSATKDWKPMAVSIVFGLAFASVLTLVLIPVVYSLIDSFFGKLKMTRFKSHLTFEEAVVDKDMCEIEK